MRSFPLHALASLAVMFALAGTLTAQNTDSLILENSRPFTVIDQISNPVERNALQEIYRTHNARERANRSEAFLAQFPQSWLLAEVYEIAAKADIELGEFEQALQYGGASLRILPENPLLLVQLANVQVNMKLIAKSEQSAQEALGYLERFGRMSTIPEKRWPEVQRELKASCFFVLGRVKTLQALNLPPGKEQSSKLTESIALLAQAKRLNPNDSEFDYLTGLDYVALGNQSEAEKWIAAASRRDGPSREMALARLEKMFAQSQHEHQLTFNQFLGSLGQPDLPQAPVRVPVPPVALPDYVGSETCGTCHVDIYQSWSHTGMARMLRPYKPENILGDFVADNLFYVGDEVIREGGEYKFIEGKNREPFARMIIDHGRHYFEIRQADHLWRRYPVDYTIGSKWQQGYVTRLPNGELQVFPIEYNVRYKKWVNFWKIIDAPGAERDDPRQWEKFSPATNYTLNCATCHTSQLRNTKGGGFEPGHLEFREGGIDCEMCHGPGGRHVASLKEGKVYEKPPLDAPVDFSKISSADSVAICSQCHLQSALRVPGSSGELNYSRESEVFFRRYKSRPFSEFFLLARYKDGRFRQTSFIVESFLRSACYRKGGATCVSCHDPHHDDAASNPTSLRFRDQPNEMCLQCHGQFKNAAALQQHTRHPLNSEGSQCISCHMPRIMEALMSLARTHRIDDIPDPQMTARFGEQESPNACLICHTDKNVAWLNQQLENGAPKGRTSRAQANGLGPGIIH